MLTGVATDDSVGLRTTENLPRTTDASSHYSSCPAPTSQACEQVGCVQALPQSVQELCIQYPMSLSWGELCHQKPLW